VGARERVVIVEVGSTWLVLGVAPGRVSALAEVPRQPTPAQAASPTSVSGEGFPDWLRKLTQRR
jgi:flagellar protein FliO/FliZ